MRKKQTDENIYNFFVYMKTKWKDAKAKESEKIVSIICKENALISNGSIGYFVVVFKLFFTSFHSFFVPTS